MKIFLWLTLFLGFNLNAGDIEPMATSEVIEALNKLSPGDNFSFNFRHRDADLSLELSEDDEMIPPVPGLYRAVSTYGAYAIEPNPKYRFMLVEFGRSIPNYKSNRFIDFREKTIIVKKTGPKTDENEGVFWFINAKNGLVESFEDGHFIGTITKVTTIENRKRKTIKT